MMQQKMLPYKYEAEKGPSTEMKALGGHPSEAFGVNAAWWWIMVLAFNLNSLMKRFVLPEERKTKRLKAIRFYLIMLKPTPG